MSKKIRMCRKLRKSLGKRRKLTFSDYRKAMHLEQKSKKQRRKDYLRIKSMLGPKKSVVVGHICYYWGKGKDMKYILASMTNFNETSPGEKERI